MGPCPQLTILDCRRWQLGDAAVRQLAAAAERAHLQVSGYTTQAQFLIAAGLDRQLERTASADLIAQVQRAGQARRLVMPGEMGETFKAMALTRGSVDPPSGFAGRDLRRVL